MNYRNFLWFVASLLSVTNLWAQSVYPGQHENKLDKKDIAAMRVKSFNLNDVRLLPSRFRDNMMRDSIWMVSLDVDRLLHSFRTNAGVFAGREGGYMAVKKLGGWESLDCELRGHTVGHLLSAYGLMYAATGSEVFKQKGDSLVKGLSEVQQALGNGYISAFPEELINRNLRGGAVWAPWYTIHKLYSGLIDQYLYADNILALDVVKRGADWAYVKLKPQSEEVRRRMIRNEFGGINESFYNLYAITGKECYRWLAEYFYHNDVMDPLKVQKDDLGTKHTNTFIPKVIAEARNYELTKNAASKQLVDFFWHTMIDSHTFAPGCSSQKEHFFDTKQFSKYLNGYTGETCCTYNMLKLSRHLFCWTADSKAADYYERALYNHILGQQDPQSGMVCYFLPMLSGAYKVYSTPENSFWCCVGSGFESHAKYGEAIYYHNEKGIYVNLFIPSVVNWHEKGLVLRQETSFPESETTKLMLNLKHPLRTSVYLRYPSWSGKPDIRVNGKLMAVKAKDGSYIELNREWKDGDCIEVTYPMELRIETTPDNPEKGALLYGPVVLAGERGTENMKQPAPFSNPKLYNDYYTYDYQIPADLKSSMKMDVKHPDKFLKKIGNELKFISSEGDVLRPLYDLHHQHYVVYWDLKQPVSIKKTCSGDLIADQTIFDYVSGKEGERAYLRLPRGAKQVKAVLYCHQNMTEEVLFRSKFFCSKMDSLGVAMAFIQRGSQNWDVREGCQERFEQIMDDFAKGTEHPEIATAPIIPFGHSAQATFPWNFAAWNPERTLCILSYHGDAPRTNLCGYGRENIEWGRTRNIDSIPGLMIEGEYEWWEGRVRPALAFRMMYPDSRISFLCDAGKGHFDLCEETQDYMARFIAKALDDSRPKGGVLYSRWKEDGTESNNPHEMFWYQDKEMMELTKARYEDSRGKKMQYVSARMNGKLLAYDENKHIKLNAETSSLEFSVEPVFVNQERNMISEEHAAVRPKVVLISGPAIQTGEYTFRFDPDYFGKDPKRLWTGITLCIEADGDDNYKSAVQELNIQVKLKGE